MATTRKQLYDDAISKLKAYIPGVSKEDFVALLLNGGIEAAANAPDSSSTLVSDSMKKAMSPVVDLINGGAFAGEIIADLDALTAGTPGAITPADLLKIRNFVRFTLSNGLTTSKSEGSAAKAGLISGEKSYVGNGAPNLGTLPGGVKGFYTIDAAVPMTVTSPGAGVVANDPSTLEPSKAKPTIAVIELLNPRIGTSVRDTAGLSIFCSMIPAHIMSRAVPYMSVRISAPDIITNGKVKSLNLIRYLRGEQAYQANEPAGMMIAFTSGTVVTPKAGGMELFTSPQTLVSELSDINSNEFGKFKPIDRFRPFMSLNDVSFEVVSAGAGLMSYKQASMSLTLHDRGRLSEISSFVKPGAYSMTEIEIEYGWSVDPRSAQASNNNGSLTSYATKDDVFAQFIDSLRSKEKYVVVNSTFQFDDAGQVNVSLTLSMKGASDMRSYDISGDIGKSAKVELKKLVEEIQKLISQTGGRAESLFGETVMGAVSSPESSLNLDEDELKKIRAEIKKVKDSAVRKGADFTAIQAGLDKIFKKDGEVAKISGDTALTTALNTISKTPEIFPCCQESAGASSSATKNNISALLTSSKNAYSKGSISLGKVLLAFVAKPLAASNQYDEIQLVFNKINARAGFVRNLSMAAFPLDKDKLEKTMKELYTKNVSVSLSQLIAVLGEDHVGNIAYPAYGFSSAYNDKGEYVKVGGVEGQDFVDKQLISAGIADCNFQQPRLSVVPECVPHRNDPSKTILRLHITDAACTPYQTYSDAVNSGRSDSAFFVDSLALSTDQKLFKALYWADLDSTEAGKLRADEISKMVKAGVLKTVANTPAKVVSGGPIETYQLDLTQLFTTGDPKVVKRFFSESLPVIRYGSAAGMVKNISVSSISDPQLATINILKQDEGSGDAETASRDKGLPLMVAPTEVSVDMLGCPIMNFGQTAYIDFGTNTTIDNIYVCTNLSHKISPGDFTTSAKFTLNVGAYGVYNSSKRSVDLTKEMLKQITSVTASTLADALTTIPDATGADLVWGTDLAVGVTAAAVESSRKSKGAAIRCWSIDASKIYKAKLNATTEIVIGRSVAATGLPNALGANWVGASYVELPYLPSAVPPGGTSRDNKFVGTRFGHSELPAGRPVTIDLKAYYDEIELIAQKAKEAKASKVGRSENPSNAG